MRPGERGHDAEADEDRARDVALNARPAAALPQGLSGRAGRQGPDRIRHEAEQHERQPEHDDLGRGPSERGVDELRQEGEEEQRGLWIEDVHDHALGEVAASPARRPLGIGVGRIGAPEQRPDPDHDQVQRSHRLDDGERSCRRDQDRGEPHRGGSEVHERADVDAEHRGEAGASTLVDASRHDVHDGRPRHDEDRERREGEHGEGFRFDDHALSCQTRRRPSSVRVGSTTAIVLECGATSSERPPVATTWASTPSSPRIAVTIPSTWPANP